MIKFKINILYFFVLLPFIFFAVYPQTEGIARPKRSFKAKSNYRANTKANAVSNTKFSPRSNLTIRVAITCGKSLSVDIPRPYVVLDSSRRKIVSRGSSFSEKVSNSASSLSVGRWRTVKYSSRLYFKIDGDGRFRVNGSSYRGDLELVARDGVVYAVNHINIEEYLKGVIGSEVSSSWPMESLKAQAVASRSFAYFHKTINAGGFFDVGLDMQVYKGMSAESSKTSEAVDITKGQVVYYGGQLLCTYFHAVCGGHTENAEAVWQTKLRFPPSVKCPYCRNSENFLWSYILNRKEIIRQFRAYGYNWRSISRILPFKIDRNFPRIRSLSLYTDRGVNEVQANKFRQVIGYNKIKSSVFTIHSAGKYYVFIGRGWGHGVGMCQSGAKTLSEKGMSYRDILKYYFPRTEIRRIY